MDALTQLQASLADRYAIEREIGSGGMATVYLARDLRHDRNVALKLLRAGIPVWFAEVLCLLIADNLNGTGSITFRRWASHTQLVRCRT